MSSIVETSSQISAPRVGARHDTFLLGMLAVALAAIVACAVLATMYPAAIDPSGVQWTTP